ncbi:MAG: hypothetical protein OXC37_02390 [Bdellovibrionaceae bacterium]|nr:hypothetical protein [Pseudobdellovibrionaceae bacterium]
MFKIFKTLFYIVFLFYSPSLLSKIHLEPYIGYSFTSLGTKNFSKDLLEKQELDKKTNQIITELSKNQFYQGISPGLRVGYSSLGLAVGADITMGYWKSLFDKNFTSFKDKQTIIALLPGLFISYKLPLLLRAYASLIPQANVILQTKKGNKNCNKTRGGKLGLSYLSLPFLSINFEYLPLYIGGVCNLWSHTGTVSANLTF